jgi:beta-alanine--pyruvate transaminase
MPAMAAANSEAIGKRVADLDYAPPFQFGIRAFEARQPHRGSGARPRPRYRNSGSEAADTALRSHQLLSDRRPGRPYPADRPRAWLSGVGFGGTSVGIVGNQRSTAPAPASIISHTYDREEAGLQQGRAGIARISPTMWSGWSICTAHDRRRDRRAMAGSTGVLPARRGYLKRLREITPKRHRASSAGHAGYGRLGCLAAERMACCRTC